ncbi:formin-like protein 20 [Abrus precatorius]|uniref:Formin-like protein 20 n=1 Tax=Abrus precatorius TaxID=3816 RepID=A0A8B8KDN5_ABRPR|nr:formin-like protein 20 [Abrus precatorius]
MEKQKFLMVVTLLLPLSNFAFEASRDVTSSSNACLNCSKCEYPCDQSSSPPPPPSAYYLYGPPPPPPPQEKEHSKCPPPPATGVQCCTPPAPYTLAPPNPYTPVPYGEGQRHASMLLPVLVPLMILFSSFIFLF